MTDPILTVHDLSVAFPNQTVFKHLDFQLERGHFLSVVGENGIGKTTLMRTILQQLKPLSGEISFHPNRKTVHFGYVPQFRNLDREYPLSIRDFVSLNLSGWKLPWLSQQEHQQVHQILAQTGLLKIQKQPLGMASGGQKQRAYLAQALVERPDLLILDESTASLDNVMKYELLDLVKQIQQQQGLSVIFVTHDVPLAKQYADDFLLLKNGTYQFGPIAQLPVNDLQEANHV